MTARKAVVTGGASGIGLAVARRLTEDDVEVVTLDLSDPADVVVDITDDVAVARAAARVGPIDILVNSAGIIGPNKLLWEITSAEWASTFAVNVTGTFNLCRAVVPGMRERGWGRIVNMASIAGKEGNARLSAYSATKAAVIGLTKALGKELASDGILVNAVAPALIETPMNATTAPDVLARLRGLIPMGRLGQPTEVAALVAWLASDKSSFSTGAEYDITGGRATYCLRGCPDTGGPVVARTRSSGFTIRSRGRLGRFSSRSTARRTAASASCSGCWPTVVRFM